MQNNPSKVRIFFIGDVIGKPGRRLVEKSLYLIKKKYKPDLVIANGENSAGGLGIIPKTASELFSSGVDVITSGNHVWDKREALELLDNNEMIIRPLNYPKSVPGKGYCIYNIKDKGEIVVVNLQGRVFMEPVVDNPFIIIEDWLKTIKSKIIIVDFHAEATAEKQAMGFFLDGKVGAFLGTHTHVPTADLRILANGTAYQSDVGMTGSLDSVIGMKRKPVIDKFITGINQRWEVAKNNTIMDMAIIDFDINTGRAVSAESHRFYNDKIEQEFGY
ncbi:MAG: TIGR00282 family metallophosphoesterase [Acidobacteriota bacterium]